MVTERPCPWAARHLRPAESWLWKVPAHVPSSGSNTRVLDPDEAVAPATSHWPLAGRKLNETSRSQT